MNSINERLKAIRAKANVLRSLRIAILDLKMSDVDQMGLTEPNHNLNEPVSRTDNNSTIVTKASRLVFGRPSVRRHYNGLQLSAMFLSSPSFKITLSVEAT
jgi:hypothetical protein